MVDFSNRVDFQPIGDQILAKEVDGRMLESGIVLPKGGNEEDIPQFVVVAVGEGRPSQFDGKLLPMPDVRVGDLILVPEMHTLPVLIGSTTHIFCKAQNIVAVGRKEASPSASK